MTELQEFRAAVVGAVGFDITKAKEVCDFVLKSDNPVATMNIHVKPTVDGIYYVMEDKSVVPAENINDLDKNLIIGVAVKALGHVATAALHDAADGEDVALIDEDSKVPDDPSAYKKSYKEANSDWNGQENTNRLRPYLNPKIGLKDNEYIPSVAQLKLLSLFANEANAALVAAGGDEFQAGGHWSSSESSSGGSWGVGFFDGGTYGYNGKYGNFTVRPSVACEI